MTIGLMVSVVLLVRQLPSSKMVAVNVMNKNACMAA